MLSGLRLFSSPESLDQTRLESLPWQRSGYAFSVFLRTMGAEECSKEFKLETRIEKIEANSKQQAALLQLKTALFVSVGRGNIYIEIFDELT